MAKLDLLRMACFLVSFVLDPKCPKRGYGHASGPFESAALVTEIHAHPRFDDFYHGLVTVELLGMVGPERLPALRLQRWVGNFVIS